MFEIGPSKITKQVLLNHNTEEKYMSHYLGINPQKGLFLSPFRNDKSPTCAFFRDARGNLIFKDFSGDFHGDFINVVEKLFGVSHQRACNIIANDFKIIKKEHYPVNPPKIAHDGGTVTETTPAVIQCTIKDYTEDELAWWESFGVSLPTLKKYKVFSVESVFVNGDWRGSSSASNPTYGYFFGIKDGLELWKVYYPMRTSARFRLNNSVIQGLKQLPKEGGNFLVITKSYKDVMALYELGIPAIAPQTETLLMNSRTMEALKKKFKTIVWNGDWDTSGKNFMIKNRKAHGGICVSFKKKDVYGKDISDFIKLHGREKAKNLIIKLKQKYNLS